MTRVRLFFCVAVVLVVAFCAFAQPALAQSSNHFQVRALPQAPTTGIKPDSNPPPTANLYALNQAFVATFFPTSNSDGTDLWPCFGNSTSPNTDCPSIGNPTVTFPTGGVALGVPAYVWSYANCDAPNPQTTYTPCGQTETWYEDDSGDSADDLIYQIVATQGTKIIADSGIVDFVGANPYGGLTPPADVIIYGDQNYGTLGATGQNNGNCDANFNYPVASNMESGITYPYVIAANKTCVDPVPGLATLTATTELATPKYTKTTKGCPSGESVCYTVKFTKKYSVTQKWNIWFQ